MPKKITKQRPEEALDCYPKHTPHPKGYIAFHEWAVQMMKTHRNIRCDECGLWAIWVPKTAGKEAR